MRLAKDIEIDKTLAELKARGITGVEEAVKGLQDLFGGTGTSMGLPIFDEKTYAKALPHFKSSYENFKKAGESLAQFFQYWLKKHGSAIRPYLKRFILDTKANLEKVKDDESSDSGKPVAGKPTNVAEGQPAGPTPPTGAKPGDAVPGGKPGSPGSTKGAIPGSEVGGRPPSRGGTRTGQAGTTGSKPTGGTATDRGEGVSEDTGNAEVRRGKDQEPTDNLRIQPEDKLVPATRSGRIQANLKAWELSKKLENAKRRATPAEKRVLMQFSGWGDTFQVFGLTKIDTRTAGQLYEHEKRGGTPYNLIYREDHLATYEKWKKQYQAAYDTLKESLTPEEWESAKESSLNAHFTSRDGIDGLWKIVERLGWDGGTAIESSAGIGNLIGLTPDKFAGKVHWVGVELDKMTAQMLGQLYPASDIQNVGFTDRNFLFRHDSEYHRLSPCICLVILSL